MKKHIPVCLVLVVASMFYQCGNAEKQAEDTLKKEIFIIHDEVMPKTSEINRLQRKLRALKKENPALDSAGLKKILEVEVQLEKAHDGMMIWMNNFKSPAKLRSSKTHEEIMQYLEQEKVNIERVRDDMLNSIDAGSEVLNNYGKKK